MMSAQIVCSPSLGQTTIVNGDVVQITVLLSLEENVSSSQVIIWHDNSQSREWTSLHLNEEVDDLQTLSIGSVNSAIRKCFRGTLPKIAENNVIHFTLKYRPDGGEWQWANDLLPVGDAEVVFSHKGRISDSLSCYFDQGPLEKQSSWPHVTTLNNEIVTAATESTHLWCISNPVAASTEGESSYRYIKLGITAKTLRWFCISRESVAWLCPRQGKGKFGPREDSILVSFLREDGLHVVVLGVSLNEVLTILKADENGCLIAVARNDAAHENTSVVLVAVGKTFDKANEAVWQYARNMVEREISQLVKSIPDAFDPKSLENWYDGFAYCTWNGLGQQLSEEKILKALGTLRDSGIRFSSLIIDDNWQSLDHYGENNFFHRWTKFEADADAFPRGLKFAITKIREQYPEIKHIAVWHGLLGYWNGISPDGAIAMNYKTKFLRKSGQGFLGEGSLIAVDPTDVERFYDDFYRFLADSGIDSVKTDTQFLLDQIGDPVDRSRFITAYQDAWTIASQRHFSSKAISCMSQIPQILFHSQLVKSLPMLMVRNSEDFFPDQRESHPWHVFCNAHNNVVTQHLNVLPDWDMFQTSHEWSAFHGAARCVSGGPIYFTDKPGEHDIKLINEMTARTTTGQAIVLRPNVARTANVYSCNNERKLLKIGTTTEKTKIPILGVFNINECATSELLSLEDFSGFEHFQSQGYIIRSHRAGLISKARTFDQTHTSQLLVELDVKGYEILTLHPLEKLCCEEKGKYFAVLGLMDKMTGAAAVINWKLDRTDSNISIQVTMKALGILGIYMTGLEEDASIVPEIRMFKEKVPEKSIEYEPPKSLVKIDLESAWETFGKPCNSGEIFVEVFIKARGIP